MALVAHYFSYLICHPFPDQVYWSTNVIIDNVGNVAKTVTVTWI